MSVEIRLGAADARLIPSFTRSAGYAVDVLWTSIDHQLAQMAEGGGLDLNPDFQRVHVWDDVRRRRFVEFCLRGGDSAREIYFNGAGYAGGNPPGPVVLVDGKQRLEAVQRFMRNGLAIFGGWKLRDFAAHHQRAFPFRHHLARLRFHVNDLATRAEVLHWYLDINSGGVAHTEDELRRVRALLECEPAARKARR